MLVTMASIVSKYTPVGDISVVALALILLLLLSQTYVSKAGNFRLLIGMLASMIVAALSEVQYELMISSGQTSGGSKTAIYSLRILHNVALCVLMFLYICYLHDPLWISRTVRKRFNIGCHSALVLGMAADIFLTVTHAGFYIDAAGKTHRGSNLFTFIYILYAATGFYLIIRYHNRIIKPIFRGLLGVNAFAVFITLLQFFHEQTAFTSVCYFMPLLGIVFLFHSNPFDTETGAVSDSYFYQEAGKYIEKNDPLMILSCTMTGFTKHIKENPDLKFEFYAFFRQNVKKGVLYRFPNERFVLTVNPKSLFDSNFVVEKMLSDFDKGYKRFGLDYRITILETTRVINDAHDYMRLIEFVEDSMPINTSHIVTEKDIEGYFDSRYILGQLEDIAKNHDLSDDRVLLYCQPVFNLSTKRYDTAEALMRLNLKKTGLVFPDKFIPLAEQYGLIHPLSMIILNKTCRAIKELNENGCGMKRISVNISSLDLHCDSFCKEVRDIITENGIPYGMIAVEITESRYDKDFDLMKRRILELQRMGIKLYLDDFGTGYSNFERIMELPFDIIKFDRSMLIESTKNHTSEYMVSTFADMFNKLGYSVLFEGVENETDEESCIRMKAGYLQGYKYSRPIPSSQLISFLEEAILPSAAT